MIKKPVLLFFALLLPVSIFLFLHFFGQNEFDIPVYYQEVTTDIPTGCQVDYKFPYKAEGSKVPLDGTTVIFFASGLPKDEITESDFQLKRVLTGFKDNPPRLVFVTTDSLTSTAASRVLIVEQASYEMEQQCIFLAKDNRMVLVDDQLQIRGLYSNTGLKEVDRLILELKILYKEY